MSDYKIILNVDDSKINRFVAKSIIDNFCPETIVYDCADGFEALKVYDELIETNHQIDMVLCDYHMPGMSGAEVLKDIRKRGYEGAFTILTADITVGEEDFPQANFVMHKPLSKEKLSKMFLYGVCTECMKCLECETEEEKPKTAEEVKIKQYKDAGFPMDWVAKEEDITLDKVKEVYEKANKK